MGTTYSNETQHNNDNNDNNDYSMSSLLLNDEENDADIMSDEEYNNYRLMQLSRVQNEAKELFERKNRDYGDAFANYGVVGVLVRMGDKIQRSASITKNGVTMVNSESLRDTLIDLANYATIGVMLLDEQDEE